MCLRLLLRRGASPSRISFPYGASGLRACGHFEAWLCPFPVGSRGGSSINLPGRSRLLAHSTHGRVQHERKLSVPGLPGAAWGYPVAPSFAFVERSEGGSTRPPSMSGRAIFASEADAKTASASLVFAEKS
jgi:hypothetical protein